MRGLTKQERFIALRAIFEAGALGPEKLPEPLALIQKLRIFTDLDDDPPIEPLTQAEGEALLAALSALVNRSHAAAFDVAPIAYKIGAATANAYMEEVAQ
jgi:hypothetical protein